MSEHSSLIHRWIAEVVEGGRVESVDELATPDCVLHGGGAVGDVGRGAFEEALTTYYATFTERRMTIEDLIEQGDRVAIRLRQQATIGGTRRAWSSNHIYRVREGRICEEWFSEPPPDLPAA